MLFSEAVAWAYLAAIVLTFVFILVDQYFERKYGITSTTTSVSRGLDTRKAPGSISPPNE